MIFRNNVDDVAVLRKELQNVQTAMMTDIHEIKSDTKLEDMRQENETLKSELSTISLKLAADQKTHSLELKFAKEESTRIQNENQKLVQKVEALSSNLTTAEEAASSERRKVDQVHTYDWGTKFPWYSNAWIIIIIIDALISKRSKRISITEPRSSSQQKVNLMN